MQSKKTYYQKAMRYIDNAKDELKKAKIQKDGLFYDDVKYVRSAAGIAYIGVEQAAKWYLGLNGIKGKFTHTEQIKDGLRKINNNAKDYFNSCYNLLYIATYLYGDEKVTTIKNAFDSAECFIAFLKPYKDDTFCKN